ncbi:hypothetical protein PORY_000719 [Pneumocystis oryctolagi]|uniref:Uncharacterized protein n=1 Tax=Pneumocystis oryctolagi TaxID=42067 RepID=A0ACB7CIU1_9ASCO|nr:hypothetical protein PORY_000719 [Pneumocystis oryctolagi]
MNISTYLRFNNSVLPPKDALIAVTSTIYVSPVFIIYHFIRTSIQNDRAVVLVSFLNDFQELGFDFSSKICSEKLVYVDGLTRLYGYPLNEESEKRTTIPTIYVKLQGESNLDDIFSAIQTGIDQASSLGEIPSLIFWGADFLVASEILTPSDLLSLVSVSRGMVHHCVVTLNADSALLSSEKRSSELETNYSIFFHTIICQSHSIVSLRQLPSGRAKEVTGIIRVSRGSGYYAAQEDIKTHTSSDEEYKDSQFEMLYWVHDLGKLIYHCLNYIEKKFELIQLQNENEYLKTITEQAALQADDDGRTSDAILLYHLSEDFDTVVSIINKVLGESLSSPTFNNYVESGDTSLKTNLSLMAMENPKRLAQNMMSVYFNNLGIYSKISSINRDACKILLKMADARTAYIEGKWEQSLAIIEQLNIIPLDCNVDIGAIKKQAQDFVSLHESIARNVSGLLVMSMESLYKLNNKLKMSPFVDSSRNAKLTELRKRAKSVMIYAGMIQYRMSSEIYSHISRLDVMF